MLVRHHAGHLEAVAVRIDLPDLVLSIVGVEGEGPRDHGLGIGRRQELGIEQPGLHPVVEARDPLQRMLDAVLVDDGAARQQ